ncbi:MAG: hypothetical protein ACREI9_02310 [Nitrospiraceae bacterium]
MSNVQTMVHWFTQNPLWAATVFFGVAIVAVTLYTYVYDYRMLADRDKH